MTMEEILAGLGMSVPQEKKEALAQAVAQSYMTLEEHQQQLQAQQFSALVEARMAAAGVRSPKAVRALLDLEALAKEPTAGAVDAALAALKVSDGYLFAGFPVFAAGTGSVNPGTAPDPMAAIYAAAGV